MTTLAPDSSGCSLCRFVWMKLLPGLKNSTATFTLGNAHSWTGVWHKACRLDCRYPILPHVCHLQLEVVRISRILLHERFGVVSFWPGTNRIYSFSLHDQLSNCWYFCVLKRTSSIRHCRISTAHSSIWFNFQRAFNGTWRPKTVFKKGRGNVRMLEFLGRSPKRTFP